MYTKNTVKLEFDPNNMEFLNSNIHNNYHPYVLKIG